MKLTTLLFFLALMQVTATSLYSQTQKVNLDFQNKTLAEVFAVIEQNSDCSFFYKNELLRGAKLKTGHYENVMVSEILDDVLKDENLTYTSKGKLIMIVAKDEAGYGAGAQQTKTVSGKVTDSSGVLLPGVTVVVKGTTQGIITDIDGNYSLPNVPGDATLVFSFVGMKTQEIPVLGKTNINITMVEETIGLDEVVAVGYGVQKKVNLTGSVSAVDFENRSLQSRSLTNVSSLLSGASSGVRVQQTNGLPSNDESASISVRGIGSLNLSSSPLVLVDGQIASMNSVSPNDVASVSILKDAASSAIYGSRASNGVILITTKSGQDTGGKVTFNLDSYVGEKSPANIPDIISNTVDYMELQNQMWLNSGSNSKWSQDQIDEYRQGHEEDPYLWPYTDVFKDVTKKNIVQKYHFSARGGNEKISFYSAFEYYNDDGLVTNTGYKKVNFRNNLNYRVNKWLKLGNNFAYINGISEPASISQIFTWMRATTPAIFTRNADGRWGGGAFPDGTGGQNNPSQSAWQARGESRTNQLQGKIFVELTPIDGLVINGSYFRDLSLGESWSGSQPADRWNFRTNEISQDFTTGALLSIGNSNYRRQRDIIDLYTNYTKTFGKHNIGVLAGYNQEYYYSQSTSASKTGILSYDTPVLDAATLNPQASGTVSDYAMRSFFGRLTYNLSGKYLFEANLRYDGSSRFSPDNRWGVFPSFSGGWIVSEEKFWEPLNNIFNTFKLRASWGILGNAGIGNYEWQSFYSSAPYSEGNDIVSGLNYTTYGNDQIHWEKTKVTNIGADFRLLKAVSFDMNYYIKTTSDILTKPPIPAILGGIGAPRVNQASVQNKGFEIEANYKKKIGQLSLSLGLNYSLNKNKIVKYQGDVIDIRGATAWVEEYPIGVFYVLEVDKIVQDQTEIDNMVADGYSFYPRVPRPGDFLYKNNNDDKSINTDDRVLKGNPMPVHLFGGNIGLEYAGFDFNASFSGVAKWDRYLNDDVFNYYYIDNYQILSSFKNMWSENNRNTNIPKIYTNDYMNHQNHDAYIHRADYLKIRSLQLGYSLPVNLINAVKVDKLRVYINAENPFTFTSWPAYDPEADGGSTLHTYPITRTISIGVNVSF